MQIVCILLSMKLNDFCCCQKRIRLPFDEKILLNFMADKNHTLLKLVEKLLSWNEFMKCCKYWKVLQS